MPTSDIISDVVQIRQGKIAKRISGGNYGAIVNLYGFANVSITMRVLTAERFGDGKKLAQSSRMVGGSGRLEFATPDLDVLATSLGLTKVSSGSGDEEVRTLKFKEGSLPYIGFVGGADDDNGTKNAFHFWVPKMKFTSDIEVLSLSGGEDFNYATLSADFEIIPDEYYVDGAQSEVQSLDITGTPTGGTFTATFGPDTTSAIAYDANASAVQTALEALNNIGSGNVAVTGTNSEFTVTFQGDLANLKLPLLTADGSSLTGGSSPDVTITRDSAGAEGDDLISTFYENEAGLSPTLPPSL